MVTEESLIHYEAFAELFKHLGINPYEFYKLSEGRVEGWFPDLPEREPKVDVKEFADLVWGRKKKKWRIF